MKYLTFLKGKKIYKRTDILQIAKILLCRKRKIYRMLLDKEYSSRPIYTYLASYLSNKRFSLYFFEIIDRGKPKYKKTQLMRYTYTYNISLLPLLQLLLIFIYNIFNE